MKKAADPDLNFLWNFFSINPDASLGGEGGWAAFITKPGTCVSCSGVPVLSFPLVLVRSAAVLACVLSLGKGGFRKGNAMDC